MRRGCGTRKSGLYIRTLLGPGGIPFDDCLIDPPRLLPEGMDARSLANKPSLYGEYSEDGSGPIVTHVIHWVGGEFYPYLPDILQEGRTHGFSFRMPPQLPIDRLTPGKSRMLLAHPRAFNTLWEQQTAPVKPCLKEIETHGESTGDASDAAPPAEGPCISKTYDLIPVGAARESYPSVDVDTGVVSAMCLRQVGETVYGYQPTGEDASGLVPAFFGLFPISGFDFVQGNNEEGYQRKWEAALAKARSAGFAASIITIDEHGEERIVEQIGGSL